MSEVSVRRLVAFLGQFYDRLSVDFLAMSPTLPLAHPANNSWELIVQSGNDFPHFVITPAFVIETSVTVWTYDPVWHEISAFFPVSHVACRVLPVNPNCLTESPIQVSCSFSSSNLLPLGCKNERGDGLEHQATFRMCSMLSVLCRVHHGSRSVGKTVLFVGAWGMRHGVGDKFHRLTSISSPQMVLHEQSQKVF